VSTEDDLPETMKVLKKWKRTSPLAVQAYQYIHHLDGNPDDILSLLLEGLFQQNHQVMQNLEEVLQKIAAPSLKVSHAIPRDRM
jgi:hypothetical protein